MLKLILTGALGQDAEVKEIGDNKLIVFSVAVSMDYRDSSDNKVEKTEWVKAQLWKSKSQSIKVAEYLKKGKKVLIEGVPNSEGYKNKNEEIKSNLVVNVREIELLN